MTIPQTAAARPPFDFARAIRAIGIALSAAHGCVATDDPAAEPGDTSWRIDHTKEIGMLGELEAALAAAPDKEAATRP
ncbi:MAG: hypothetical protein V4726_00905 [Verrucomicrobiota bacterium]